MTIDFPCVNCDGPIPWERRIKVYCTTFCREQVKHIRWMRSTIYRGVWDDPEVAEARKIRIAHLNSGGYMSLGRRIPIESRHAVRDKFQDICAQCGEDAIDGEIDHISGSSNSLENLQLLCSKCHREKTLANIRPIPPDDPRIGEIEILHEELHERAFSFQAKKICDNHISWSEKEPKLRKTRKLEYFRFLAPVVKPMIESGMSKNAIKQRLNEIGIPTISGYYEWSKDATREMIRSLE